MQYCSLPADDIRYPFHHGERQNSQLGSIGRADRLAGIRDKTLSRRHAGLKIFQGLNVVVRDTRDAGTEIAEVRQPGGKGFRLHISAGRKSLGEEIEHERALFERLLQLERFDLPSEDRRRLKRWRDVTRLQRAALARHGSILRVLLQPIVDVLDVRERAPIQRAVQDLAVLCDDERLARRKGLALVGHLDPVGIACLESGVADKLLWRCRRFLESVESIDVIPRDPDNLCPEFCKIRQPGGVGFRLDGSALAEGLREKV